MAADILKEIFRRRDVWANKNEKVIVDLNVDTELLQQFCQYIENTHIADFIWFLV